VSGQAFPALLIPNPSGGKLPTEHISNNSTIRKQHDHKINNKQKQSKENEKLRKEDKLGLMESKIKVLQKSAKCLKTKNPNHSLAKIKPYKVFKECLKR